jgi:hypothetical protein
VERLQDKITELSIHLSELNTKVSVVIFIGSSIGALLVAQLFTTFFSPGSRPSHPFRRKALTPEEVNETIR